MYSSKVLLTSTDRPLRLWVLTPSMALLEGKSPSSEALRGGDRARDGGSALGTTLSTQLASISLVWDSTIASDIFAEAGGCLTLLRGNISSIGMIALRSSSF